MLPYLNGSCITYVQPEPLPEIDPEPGIICRNPESGAEFFNCQLMLDVAGCLFAPGSCQSPAWPHPEHPYGFQFCRKEMPGLVSVCSGNCQANESGNPTFFDEELGECVEVDADADADADADSDADADFFGWDVNYLTEQF